VPSAPSPPEESDALPVLDPEEALADESPGAAEDEPAADETFEPAMVAEPLAPPVFRPPPSPEPPTLVPGAPRVQTGPPRPPRTAAPLQPQDAWAEAVPFELAPPGEPRPPQQPAAPLTSTFSLLRADLAETNALKIYVQAARASATGLFFFDLEDRTTTLYMRRGNPESAESTHASDAIGPFLLAQRLATPEQVARAEKEAVKFGNDVLAALFTMGAVNPGLVFPALAQRAADILLGAYLSPRGSFASRPSSYRRARWCRSETAGVSWRRWSGGYRSPI
jgi:hypothetical protein